MRIGIDLGGTKTEVIALSEQGEQLFRHRLPTPRDDYHQTIETIARLVEMAEQATGQSGTVGPVSTTYAPRHSSSRRGRVLFTRELPVMSTISQSGRINSQAESG